MRLVIPASSELAARTRREVSGKRTGWTRHEIERLLATPLFAEGPKQPDDALFWAPLIAAHTAMRAEEILQLRGTDIARGWIHVQISDPETQSAKNAPSLRKVPIHSNLTALGLVELARRAGSGRLFPRARRSAARGKLSETFSKRFGYYRRNYRYLCQSGRKTDPSSASNFDPPGCGRDQGLSRRNFHVLEAGQALIGVRRGS